MIVALAVDVFSPLFSVRDPLSWGVRKTFILPTPRTVIGALCRGVGVVMGFGSGEEKLGNKPIRKILTYAFEKNTIATVHALSPIIRSSQLLHIVPEIEQGASYGGGDAFKHEIMCSNQLRLIYIIDLSGVNTFLKKHKQSMSVNHNALEKASNFIERLGASENICTVLKSRLVKPQVIKNGSVSVNTYVPLNWLRDPPEGGLIAESMPNIAVIESIEGRKIDFRTAFRKEYRLRKAPYFYPLKPEKTERGTLVYHTHEIEVSLRNGFVGMEFKELDSKIIVPKGMIEGAV